MAQLSCVDSRAHADVAHGSIGSTMSCAKDMFYTIRIGRLLHEVQSAREQHGLQATGDMQGPEDVTDMHLDGPGRNLEASADELVGKPFG
jgi:hypothetical protein